MAYRQPRPADPIASAAVPEPRLRLHSAGSGPAVESRRSGQFARWAPLALVASLVALAALLRLTHLATNPGWDGDEGYNINIALNLAAGRHQMFGLDFVFVQHPPLYFALVAGLFRLFGPGMLALRLVSVLFALGTLLLLLPLGYLLVPPKPENMQRVVVPGGAIASTGRSALRSLLPGTALGQLSALFYAVWPFVVMQNRFGYTYNALGFWTLLTLWGLLRYRRGRGTGSLLVSGLAASAALTTDQEAVYLLPLLFFGLSGGSMTRRAGLVALALVGPALYIGAMALTDRAALLFDITHTAGRVAGGSATFQVMAWLYNLADLMRIDPLLPLGLTGLALVPHRASRRLLLGLLAAMLLVILKVRDPNPLFRTAEPLLPLACVGAAALCLSLWGKIARAARATRVALVMLLLPGGIAVYSDANAALGHFRTPIDGALPRSTADATAMSAWLNRRLRPSDLVLAMPQVSWMFHARTAELLQAVASTGHTSAFYPSGIPCRRWVYPVGIDAARYLVIDHFTWLWIAANPPERTLVEGARRDWSAVYRRGEYVVYENPNPVFSGCSTTRSRVG